MQFYCIGGSGNQSVSGVTTICLAQCNTSPSHRVDLVVDCGLCNVDPLLFNGCVKLLDIGRNWNTLSYTPIQSIPNMLKGWHVRWVCWPCNNWDVFSFQDLCTDPCNMGPCIIMLQHEVMVVDEWHNNGPQYLIEILCFCKPIVTAAVRAAGLRRSWRWRCWMWRSWGLVWLHVVCGCEAGLMYAKFCETPLEVAYCREIKNSLKT